jgi:hypothetical protein
MCEEQLVTIGIFVGLTLVFQRTICGRDSLDERDEQEMGPIHTVP